MPLLINLRLMEEKNILLKGEITSAELDLEKVDTVIEILQPVQYDLEVQKFDRNILAQGSVKFTLQCHCVRCLKAFHQRMSLENGNWACHLALEGEEKADVINDTIDLTPYLREDILLSFPQHPLCEKDCKGLPKAVKKMKQSNGIGQTQETSSAWAELNKLKF